MKFLCVQRCTGEYTRPEYVQLADFLFEDGGETDRSIEGGILRDRERFPAYFEGSLSDPIWAMVIVRAMALVITHPRGSPWKERTSHPRMWAHVGCAMR
jgi:hypothetical protein